MLNKIGNDLFLAEKIRFLEIYEVIRGAMDRHRVTENPGLETILQAEKDTEDWIESRWMA